MTPKLAMDPLAVMILLDALSEEEAEELAAYATVPDDPEGKQYVLRTTEWLLDHFNIPRPKFG